MATLAHEKMTPINAMINVSHILQNTLDTDITTMKYGDPHKVSGEDTLFHQKLPVLLYKVIEDQKKMYELVRVIWSSAHILNH